MRKNTFKVWSAVLAFIIGFEAASPELVLRRQDANAADIVPTVTAAGNAGSAAPDAASAAAEAMASVKNDMVYEAESTVTASRSSIFACLMIIL